MTGWTLTIQKGLEWRIYKAYTTWCMVCSTTMQSTAWNWQNVNIAGSGLQLPHSKTSIVLGNPAFPDMSTYHVNRRFGTYSSGAGERKTALKQKWGLFPILIRTLMFFVKVFAKPVIASIIKLKAAQQRKILKTIWIFYTEQTKRGDGLNNGNDQKAG